MSCKLERNFSQECVCMGWDRRWVKVLDWVKKSKVESRFFEETFLSSSHFHHFHYHQPSPRSFQLTTTQSLSLSSFSLSLHSLTLFILSLSSCQIFYFIIILNPTQLAQLRMYCSFPTRQTHSQPAYCRWMYQSRVTCKAHP